MTEKDLQDTKEALCQKALRQTSSETNLAGLEEEMLLKLQQANPGFGG
jgi:hypothetical protein